MRASIPVAIVLVGLARCVSAFAEERPPLSDPEVRASAVARRTAEAEARKAEALQFARANGLPVREEAGGRTYEIKAVRNGRALYNVTHNVNAAISTGADRIRNTSPYSLDGAGLTVGVWDGGWVLDTHQEFGGRVTIMDTGGVFDDHATHVAGTIGAAGVDPLAEGMAPGVDIHSYEWTSDYAEMTSRGATYAGEAGKMYVSNHSYGFFAGWEVGYWASSPFVRYHWGYWAGPWPGVSGSKYEDFFGRYEDEAVLVDQVARDCPYYLVFCSAGNDRNDNPAIGSVVHYWDGKNWKRINSYNSTDYPNGDGLYDGGYDTVAGWAVAKNVMVVGSVTDAVSGSPGSRDPSAASMSDFSCWGPTDDGRIKPDIVANGDLLYSSIAASDTSYDDTYSGTSMSSPNASGSATLLVEYYMDLFPGDAMRASTLKALIIHTADDMGNPGPDYSYGWGLMNAEAAANVIKHYAELPAGTKIIEGTVSASNPSDGYTITWDGTYPIRATLSWTDPPGTATTVHDDTASKLVNDLDLVVTGPGPTTFLPYVLVPASPSSDATTGENDLDNVEQVYITAPPAAGDYTVTVDYDGTITGTDQYYSLIITGGPKPPPTVSGVAPGSAGRVVVSVAVDGDNFQPGAEVKLQKTGETDIQATVQDVGIGSIQCTFDLAGAAFGDWDVVVTNPDGQSATLPAGFTVLTSMDITAVAASPGSVAEYSKLELEVTLANVVATELYEPDPAYDGLDLRAKFIGPAPDYTEWDVNGFYDGSSSKWLLRFAPDTTGDWTFEVAASDASGTDTWTGGAFACTASANPGWLRINGNYLEFAEGGFFFGVGHNNGWQYEPLEEPTLAQMAAQGEDLFSFWMATPWAQPSWTWVEEPFWEQRAPIENMEQGIGTYNQAACAYIDYLVGEAETQGVYLLPTIWAHDQLCETLINWPKSWSNNAYGSLGISAEDFYTTQSGGEDTEQWRYQKNFYRYLIARWGHSAAITGWVLVAEIDGTDGYVSNPTEASTWLAAARDYFGAADLYRVNESGDYPMAVSKVDFVAPNDATTWASGLGVHAVDSYDSSTSNANAASTIASQTIEMRGSSRPSFHSECGGNVNGGASQPEHLHNTIWAGAAAGAAMTPLVWCDEGDYPMLTDATVGQGMRDQLRYMSEFMSNVTCFGGAGFTDALPEIKDTLDLVDPNYEAWGMKVADEGYAWIRNTAGDVSGTGAAARTLTVTDLTSGTYDVTWYNAWASGATPFSTSSPVTVAVDGILVVDIPELTLADTGGLAASGVDIAATFKWAGPTHVLMGGMSARSAGVGTVIEWITESELGNLGFHVLRRRCPGGAWKRVTASLMPGRLTAVGPAQYRYLDFTEPGRYEYRIETVSTGGVSRRHGSRRRMTVTVSSDDLVPSVIEMLLETPGVLADRAADVWTGWRARASAEARLRRPAEAGTWKRRPPKRRSAPGVGAGSGPARLLASAAGHVKGRSTLPPGARPSPGDVRIRTRGDGVYFVPAGVLPCGPERAELIIGGMRSRPLEAGPAGIWFFAAGYRDDYTDLNAAFVTPGRTSPRGRRPPRAPASLFSCDATTVVTHTVRSEEDRRFMLGAEGAPDPWFFADLLATTGTPEKEITVQAPGLAGGRAALRVAVFGYTRDDDVEPDHELLVSVNGTGVADLVWDGRGYEVFEIELPEGAVREGPNSVRLLVPEAEAIPVPQGVALDYVELDYPRTLSVARDPLLIELDRPCVVEVAGLEAPSLWVVDLAAGSADAGPARRTGAAFRPAAPAQGTGGAYLARFPARAGVYYVATPGQVRAPVEVTEAEVAALPVRAGYLAIGPERFRWPVAPLLEARRDAAGRGGAAPAYVSLESAVDTFGHGRYGAEGVAALVRELRPRYVLLVGDNSRDYFDREGTGVDPMVPAVLVGTSRLSQTNADVLYGDLDSDGVPDVPVGRLPVRTVGELEALVDKIVRDEGPGCRVRGALVADEADEANDFAAAQEAVAARFAEVGWTKLYAGVHGSSAVIKEKLTAAVNSGTDLVVYQGHGSSFKLGRAGAILDLEEAARWNEPPVVYLSTCWGAYVQKATESAVSLAEVMLRSERGPAVVIGSTAASMQHDQEALLNDFLRALLQGGERVGDALLFAQREAAARAASARTDEERRAALDTVHCYAVLGDPAMPVIRRASDGPQVPAR